MIYLYQLREILTNLIIKKLFKKYLKKVLTLKSIFDIIKTVKESQTLTIKESESDKIWLQKKKHLWLKVLK
jgi:hypothetical protein